MIEPLNEYEEAILRYTESESPTIKDIIEEFSVLSNKQINHAMRELFNRKYIKTEEVLAPGVYFAGNKNNEVDTEEIHTLTPLGKNYLAQSTANFTSFSNISNSNIAHNSTNVQQTIRISKQPRDIQEKYKELQDAITKKDSSAMKKAFGYIADKSIDVAIAIATGALLR